MLSRKSKGWYGLGVSGFLYTLGSLWLITELLALGGPADTMSARQKMVLTAGVPLFVALVICAEAMFWLPRACGNAWARWRTLRSARDSKHKDNSRVNAKGKR